MDYVELKLSQGKTAKVCTCHLHLVGGHKWSVLKTRKKFYAVRNPSIVERAAGSTSLVYMHAVINGTPKGFETDHINEDGLDNRHTNLRTATASQNRSNQGLQANNTSGFKGVCFVKATGKWMASTTIYGKHKTIGFYKSAEDAARAYDKAMRELRGEFANPNFKEQE